jgi:hypothetical protein
VPATRWNSTDYRRCARRLRHVHRANPARLASSLKELSLAYDATTSFTPGQSESASAAPDRVAQVRDFAQRVSNELDGATLRYSSRIKLLHDARGHGIRRFDANLIIASVQERVQGRVAGSGVRVQERKAGQAWRTCAAAFLVIQGLILAGATYVFAS